MKKMIALTMVLVLCLGLAPAAVATVVDLTPLDTPAVLEWGTHYPYQGDGASEDIPGTTSWSVSGTHQGQFEYSIYEVSDPTEPKYNTHWSSIDQTEGMFSSDDFIIASNEMESGTYYFTVQAVGDRNNYTSSGVARSDSWTYVKPEARLSTPAAVVLTDEDGYPVANLASSGEPYFGGYEFKLFFSNTENGEKKSLYGTWQLSKTPQESYDYKVSNWELQEHGPGYYYLQVRALSNDITKSQNSEWSPMGTSFDFGAVYYKVKDQLDAISSDATAQDIRAAVQTMGDLKAALAADQRKADGVAAKLDALEAQAGVTKSVAVDEALGDTFDAQDVKFVGAALNDLADGASEVKLSVAPLAEGTDLVIPTLYNDTVVTKFSMDVEGVADTSELKVPVRITLPVPSHINPGFLVVLHYDSQGVPVAIKAPELHTYMENGKWMASFVVDHFSNFALTELKQDESTDPEEPTKPEEPTPVEDKLTLSKNAASVRVGGSASITATVSGYGGKSVYAISADADIATVSVRDKTLTLKGVAEGETSVYVIMSDTKAVTLDAAKADPSMKEIKVTVSEAASGSSTGVSGRPSAAPVPTTKPASETFADVVKDSWYEAGVTFVVNKGIFNGVGGGLFAPAENMTRAMLMTVLARLDGQDTNGGENWYAKGMDWAKAQGISDGTALEANVTREQLVTMLYRYAKSPARQADLTAFADGQSVSDWAQSAMEWAVSQGILTGKDGNRLDPQGTATRAEVATILQRYVEKSGK